MPDGVCKSPSNDNMIKKIKVISVWSLLYRLGMIGSVLFGERFDVWASIMIWNERVARGCETVISAWCTLRFWSARCPKLVFISSVDVNCMQQVVMFFPIVPPGNSISYSCVHEFWATLSRDGCVIAAWIFAAGSSLSTSDDIMRKIQWGYNLCSWPNQSNMQKRGYFVE